MTDIAERAKAAREKLAAALALLQTPEASGQLDTVAEPVARAMGALHSIESKGLSQMMVQAPVALDAVRQALSALQTGTESATTEQATAAIAGSLGLVHGLAEDAKNAPQSHPGVSGLDQTQLSSDPPPGAAASVAQANPASAVATASPSSGPKPELSEAPTRPEGRRRTSSKRASLPPGGIPSDVSQFEANLGAHSPTNFYKGLAGNDVVDDGGLFVATYEIPAIGTKLWLTVNMPGGYEFQGLAEVKWTRESGVGDAPPGYGCAFESLSPDARKLVYRYVKNREPLFHDDL